MRGEAEQPLPSKSRLRWLCRRGMKELDVLLERYFNAEVDAMPVERQHLFYALLQFEDPQLYAYLMGRDTPANAELAALVVQIRDYRAGTSRASH